MARVLKRPMFRRGGPTNDGIMSGLEDRKKFQNNPLKNFDIPGRARELTPELAKLLEEFTPETRLPLGQIGLNLASGKFAGDGFLSNLVGSIEKPLSEFTKRDDAREAAIRSGAAKLGITQAMEEAKARAKGTSKFLKSNPPDRVYQDLYAKYTDPKGKTGFGKQTIQQIYPGAMAEFGSYIQSAVRSNPVALKNLDKFQGLVPHTINTKNEVTFNFENMIPGGFYFHPGIKKFIMRDSEKNSIITYNPYTFEKLRETPLGD